MEMEFKPLRKWNVIYLLCNEGKNVWIYAKQLLCKSCNRCFKILHPRGDVRWQDLQGKQWSEECSSQELLFVGCKVAGRAAWGGSQTCRISAYQGETCPSQGSAALHLISKPNNFSGTMHIKFKYTAILGFFSPLYSDLILSRQDFLVLQKGTVLFCNISGFNFHVDSHMNFRHLIIA